MRPGLFALILSAAALGGCATMAPAYHRPALPVAQAWPDPAQDAQASAGDLAWREVFPDPRLQGVIALALTQNRDLRVAIANIERARALHRIQQAELLPSIGAAVSASRVHTPRAITGGPSAQDSEEYSATVGFSGYELDLFGRVRSLNQAALQAFFASVENRRAAQISLIAEVAADYLRLAADEDQQTIIRGALQTREASLDLAQKRFNAGAASELDLRQAQTLTEQARSDLAVITAVVGEDRDALRLVVGAEIPPELSPGGGLERVAILADLPAGMPADVLTRRPDVRAAEHLLQAQNANIGAARAAFFPRIVLTGATGTASPDLGGLFTPGTGVWSFTPQISLPIFSGGANIANLRGTRAGRHIALAQYERAVQSAFRDVADALAVRATIRDRVAAQERLAAAAATTVRLSQARYDRGIDSYLTLLDAQRTYYAAQQTLLGARLAEVSSRVDLYKALGGGVR